MKEFLKILRESLPEIIGGLILAGIFSVLGVIYIGFGMIGAALISIIVIAIITALVIVSLRLAPKRSEQSQPWTRRDLKGLEERQAIFEELEARYLRNAETLKNLTIRKETSASFLAIPEDGTNVFIDHDNSQRRMETAIRRKTVYRRLIERGARLKIILSLNPSGIFQRGYSKESSNARLQALRSFLGEYFDNDNFEIVMRSPGVEYRRFSIYNTDVMIESAALRPPHERGDRSSVITEPTVILHELKSFDERFALYRDLNLKAADKTGVFVRAGTSLKRSKANADKKSEEKTLKDYLISEIDKELSTLRKV